MPERLSKTSVHLEVAVGANPAHEIPASDTPFQILIIGDFSGRANRGLDAPLAGRRPMQVDCDNLDDTVEKMEVALNLPQLTLRFRELDDFHPDHIYRNGELFRKLEETRERPPRALSPAAKPPELKPGRSLLDQMMEAETASTPAPADPADSLADFIRKAIAPHLEKSDPGKQQWSARVDVVASEQMRAALHHPDFQAVEAAWRGVQMLVQRLDPDRDLRIYLLDATLREPLKDPHGFTRCLAASREPWAAIVGNFAFGQSADRKSVV